MIAIQGVKSKDKKCQSTSHATPKVFSQSRFSITEDETLEEMRVDQHEDLNMEFKKESRSLITKKNSDVGRKERRPNMQVQTNSDLLPLMGHNQCMEKGKEVNTHKEQSKSAHGNLKGKPNQAGAEEDHWVRVITGSTKLNTIRRELVSSAIHDGSRSSVPSFVEEHHQDAPGNVKDMDQPNAQTEGGGPSSV